MSVIKDQQKLTTFKGNFSGMSKTETFQKAGLQPIQRSTVVVTTEDGQTAYFEARKKMIETIKSLGLKSGDKVEVGFVFMGTEKGDKVFNNLFINSITRDA